MTRMTYDQAICEVLEYTEIGYTQKSQDRLWTCFIVDSWSEDLLRGNRLYFNARGMSYDMWDIEWVWTSRAEAEAFRAETQEMFDAEAKRRGEEPIRVYVINWGDDHRFEESIVNGSRIERGKFAGSTEAIAKLNELYLGVVAG